MSNTVQIESGQSTVVDIEDIVISDEDLMDVQLRNRMDVGH